MGDNVTIRVDNVSKVFKLPHEKYTSIKSNVVNFYRRRKGYELQHALKNVSFEVKKGEFFGIVGRNGSGKSTLLKILAGIYYPTGGSITTSGTIIPFIELGVGFSPELTGRENVFLNGALLGFSRKEMKEMYQDIVDFAEIGKFMDQKLKNYSSGMQVRLAFSIAIRARGDILLLDEVLAVGDAAFQQKCFNYFARLKREKRTVILVTHDMQTVLRYCDRVMVIDQGKVEFNGAPLEASEIYLDTVAFKTAATSNAKTSEKIVTERTIVSSSKVKRGEKIRLKLKMSRSQVADVWIGVSFLKNGQYLGGINTRNDFKLQLNKKPIRLELEVDTASLAKGKYNFGHAVFVKADNEIIEERIDGPTFEIIDSQQTDSVDGVIHIDGGWRRLPS